jgi:hypothetical protein
MRLIRMRAIFTAPVSDHPKAIRFKRRPNSRINRSKKEGVCVAFTALSAMEEDYEAFVVTDACGTFNEVTRHAAWGRMQAGGAQLMS